MPTPADRRAPVAPDDETIRLTPEQARQLQQVERDVARLGQQNQRLITRIQNRRTARNA